MWKDTDFARRLGLAAPIVQGPFGGGISSVELVVAVNEAGGLGSFGAHHLDAAGIRDTAAAIRARTGRPFAFNLWVPLDGTDEPAGAGADFERGADLLEPFFRELGVARPAPPPRFTPPYAEQVEAVLAARPAVFSFVFGIPDADVLRRCRGLGISTLGTATSVDEARALAAAGVDMIVASGFEAGGHRVSFLKRPEDSLAGTLSLVPQIVDAVRVPVLAAGGIADGRGIAAAMMLGAQGVQIGTAFLACRESNAGDAHRRMLFSPAARETALTRAFSGRLARGIRNRMLAELEPHAGRVAPYPIQNWLTGQLKRAAREQERPDLMSLWCGQSAGLLAHRDAASLMSALVADTSRLLAGAG